MIQWLNKSFSEAQKASSRVAPLPPPSSTLRSNILSKPSYQIDHPKQFNEIGLNLKSNIGRSLLGSVSNNIVSSSIPYSAAKYTTNAYVVSSSPNKSQKQENLTQDFNRKEFKSNNMEHENTKISVRNQKTGNKDFVNESEKSENLLTFNKSNQVKKNSPQLDEKDQNDEFEREENEESILPIKYTQPDDYI